MISTSVNQNTFSDPMSLTVSSKLWSSNIAQDDLAIRNSIIKLNIKEKEDNKKSMGEKWRKVIDEYEIKTKKAYDLEEAKQAREIVFKDETVAAIAKVIKSKEKELDINTDKVMEGFYSYTDKFFKILSKETKTKLDEVASFYSKKYRVLNDKIAEIEAVLEMTETYEQMKEVLLQYGVLNWNEEK
mgnify:CR=1 FL=1